MKPRRASKESKESKQDKVEPTQEVEKIPDEQIVEQAQIFDVNQSV